MMHCPLSLSPYRNYPPFLPLLAPSTNAHQNSTFDGAFSLVTILSSKRRPSSNFNSFPSKTVLFIATVQTINADIYVELLVGNIICRRSISDEIVLEYKKLFTDMLWNR